MQPAFQALHFVFFAAIPGPHDAALNPADAIYLDVFAFLLGAAIGSFLNVCIYRLPRNLSVNQPRRSFCPSCNYQIPWHHNLPLISWLVLRGKCANCGGKIAFRYFGVELLTGVLFLAVWLRETAFAAPTAWPPTTILALPYWIFVGLLVVATFIDFEHFIIPDEITWGGAIAGFILSLAIPTLHGTESHFFGALWSAVGALTGYLLLWGVVELGKLVFGRKQLKFEKPSPLSWIRKGQDADLKVAEDEMLWSDFFVRGNEQVLMECPWIEIDGERRENVSVRWTLDWIHVGDDKWQLEKTDAINGEVTQVTFPREAMGFGDVKFMACIGAFLGWQAVLFTVMAGSVVGAVIGLLGLLAGRREWSAKIPFGPYLALGAVLWVFAGREIVQWYWQFAAIPK